MKLHCTDKMMQRLGRMTMAYHMLRPQQVAARYRAVDDIYRSQKMSQPIHLAIRSPKLSQTANHHMHANIPSA